MNTDKRFEFVNSFYSQVVDYLKTVATDGMFELAEERSDFKMSNEDFEEYVRYHFAICEKRELLGNSSYLLYICKKK